MQIGARSNGSGQIDFMLVSACSLLLPIEMISLSFRFGTFTFGAWAAPWRGTEWLYMPESMILNRLSRRREADAVKHIEHGRMRRKLPFFLSAHKRSPCLWEIFNQKFCRFFFDYFFFEFSVSLVHTSNLFAVARAAATPTTIENVNARENDSDIGISMPATTSGTIMEGHLALCCRVIECWSIFRPASVFNYSVRWRFDEEPNCRNRVLATPHFPYNFQNPYSHVRHFAASKRK